MPDSAIIVAARPRLRVAIGAAVVLVLAALAIAVLVSVLGSHGETTTIGSPKPFASTTAAATTAAPRGQLFVHVVGAVSQPGLFVLATGDRVVDAVAAAGGFTGTADQTQVNLARVLADGEQIVVPVVGEAAAGPPGTAGGAATVGGKVNLNSADSTALETLPRVGPAMSKRIIDWRTTNGRFTAIEDLMSVTGVGQKTFDGLKDLVTV